MIDQECQGPHHILRGDGPLRTRGTRITPSEDRGCILQFLRALKASVASTNTLMRLRSDQPTDPRVVPSRRPPSALGLASHSDPQLPLAERYFRKRIERYIAQIPINTTQRKFCLSQMNHLIYPSGHRRTRNKSTHYWKP